MGIERTDIGNAIIAGIASGETALEQMGEIVAHLERAGFVIVTSSEIERLRAALGEALIWLDCNAKNESRYQFRDEMIAAVNAAFG